MDPSNKHKVYESVLNAMLVGKRPMEQVHLLKEMLVEMKIDYVELYQQNEHLKEQNDRHI